MNTIFLKKTCLFGRQLMLFSLIALISISCSQPPGGEKKVLVFSKTSGFRHSSIAAGIEAIKKLGSQHNFAVDATEDASWFNEDNLKNYSAVIFLNTTGDVFDYYQQADFERYIQAGGGFVGIHAATDTEYEWPWYGRLVGAYFNGHPAVQKATINVNHSHKHPALEGIPESFTKEDEFYNFKNINPNLNVLMTIDENSYKGGTNGDNHPVTWYHDYDGGRAFYTEFGHTDQTYVNPEFLKIVLGGINYAMGNGVLNYSKATSDRVPEENRFVQTVLAESMDEPMEMDVLDRYSLIIVERKGAVRVFNTLQNKLKTIATIPVYTGQEDGLLGVAVDPDYKNNHWIYMIYSPPGDEPKQNVSRFVFDGKNLDMESEKIVLEIATQRDECCHSGGSLEFDAQGNLYISVGDDTNPFKSNGYAPIDESPGRSAWDAQKSSANTNDLRGKILRIKPEADGSYSIPEGNLFPPGTPKTRPEIYVMGCRNPYRISIDKERGYLYWGDVGPDAGKNDSLRGPKGHDEINQARHAGFWGWPFTRGDNKAYYDYDFENKTSGKQFNPQALINDSPYNTGKRELPPAQPSFIWYGYDKSEEFPWVGTGGRTAMAGPVFYSHHFLNARNAFPDYFDGKLFAYEWIRNWIYIITTDEEGNYMKAEPFIPNTKLIHTSDMVFGHDGSLYLLEYGDKWFKQNADSRLSKIEYVSGNRKPIARITTDKQAGGVPLKVRFSAANSEDYDKDSLTYQWSFTGENGVESVEQNPSFIFKTQGKYKVTLTVTDTEGNASGTTQEIQAGNTPPEVRIVLDDTTSLYKDYGRMKYKVVVTDKEDGSTEDGSIKPSDILVTFHYIPQGKDMTLAAQGHQIKQIPEGKVLMDGSDCKACHAIDKKVNGPALMEIAKKYTKSDTDYLVKKVLNGGSGVWGETVMSAHPQLAEADVQKMVEYILSLNEVQPKNKNQLAAEGVVKFTQHLGDDKTGIYLLKASYIDKGNQNMEPLFSSDQVIWKKENSKK
ncbi:ThuA domain-containing protein [Reichenbachiella sp. MALMAid0571]|uniref:ThuA domain-containing protein n=1 Tax=Reichenbachiella sp. MALMAid0571 TaxID=3143939 RepID=UPI0032DEDED5